MKKAKQKLYCYVDETGQDTKGDIFIVSVVLTGNERDKLLNFCEEIEEKSGKGKFKWGKAEPKRRLDYLRRIFSSKSFKWKLRYSIYKEQVNYDMATIVGIAKAVHFKEPSRGYTASIYIDGLHKTKRHKYGSELRKLGVHTRKVQGVAKDENNSLTRLADAIAGFVRDALTEEDGETQKLFHKTVKDESLVEV